MTKTRAPSADRGKHRSKASAAPDDAPLVPGAAWFTGRRAPAISLSILLAITIALFSKVLFGDGDAVLSQPGTDISQQFLHVRAFGFGELRHGNLALWNPYNFSGQPFFGGFQSGLLYPLNFPFLILPVARALNVVFALHVFLLGALLYAWTARRGLHPAACLTAGAAGMLSGPYFLHIYAGHCPNVCTMAWAPLVLLALDAWCDTRAWQWVLAGAFAAAMQILGGHPQYVYYTALTAGIYSLYLAVKTRRFVAVLGGTALMYAGAAAITAVQLLAGWDASASSVRSGGVAYNFAAVFSLPPENFLTLLVPDFFGDMTHVAYWGRCYLWEMSLFIGVTSLALAVVGRLRGAAEARRFSLGMAGLLFLLALGAHTPLHRFLFDYLPVFGSFRGASKFAFLAALFLVMAAAVGLDALLRKRGRERELAIGVFILGLVGFAASFIICAPEGDLWPSIMAFFPTTKEIMIRADYSDPAFIRRAAAMAAGGLRQFSGICAALAAVLYFMDRRKKLAWALPAMAMGEMIFFAAGYLTTFQLGDVRQAAVEKLRADDRGDYRILNVKMPDSAMSDGVGDLWGDDPGVPKRYAEFMARTQGLPPDAVIQYLPIRRMHKWLAMLRCRYMIVAEGKDAWARRYEGGLPHVLLLDDYRVATRRDAIFAAMDDPEFDPSRTVILEEKPSPAPVKSEAKGQATLREQTTDSLLIEVDAPSPAILLITDGWDRGWRAIDASGSGRAYRVLPADYVLRAVPLEAGRHLIRMEYLPQAYRIGKWISLVSLILFLSGAATVWTRSNRGVRPRDFLTRAEKNDRSGTGRAAGDSP